MKRYALLLACLTWVGANAYGQAGGGGGSGGGGGAAASGSTGAIGGTGGSGGATGIGGAPSGAVAQPGVTSPQAPTAPLPGVVQQQPGTANQGGVGTPGRTTPVPTLPGSRTGAIGGVGPGVGGIGGTAPGTGINPSAPGVNPATGVQPGTGVRAPGTGGAATPGTGVTGEVPAALQRGVTTTPGVGIGETGTGTAADIALSQRVRAQLLNAGLGVTPGTQTAPPSLTLTPQSLANVEINANNGAVTLNGRVRSEVEKRLIETRIRQMTGIGSIANNLVVDQAAARGGAGGLGTAAGAGTGTSTQPQPGVAQPNSGTVPR